MSSHSSPRTAPWQRTSWSSSAPLATCVGFGLPWLGPGLALGGSARADLVPLVLAAATGAATLATTLVGKRGGASRLTFAAMLAGLALLHLLGFELAQIALPNASAAMLSPGLAILVLASFLGIWVWQSRRIASRSPLPAPLYVRLLNAGALRPVLAGDRP